MRTECRALLYGGDFASVAHFTTSGELDALVVKAVPSLDELLKDLDTIKHYPYDKTFDEVRDEPCLVLHSSGSTGKTAPYSPTSRRFPLWYWTEPDYSRLHR